MTRFLPRAIPVLVLFLVTNLAAAQWTPTQGPMSDSRPVYDLEVIGDTVWLSNDGHYTMLLDGDAWTGQGYAAGWGAYIEPAGDSFFLHWGAQITRRARDGSRPDTLVHSVGDAHGVEMLDAGLFVGYYSSIAVSIDSGGTWRSTEEMSLGTMRTFVQSGSMVLAGSHIGIYRSSDTGRTWLPTTIGLPGYVDVLQMESAGTTVLAATSQGLFKSVDAGTTWSKPTTAFDGDTVNTLRYHQGSLLAGSNHGIFISTNAGATWRPLGLDSVKVTAIAASGSYIFAGAQSSGTYTSSDNGRSWRNIRSGLASGVVNNVATFKGIVLASGPSVWYSADKGETWGRTRGAALQNVHLFATAPSTVYAASGTDLYSSEGGIVWRHIDSSLARSGIEWASQIQVHREKLFLFNRLPVSNAGVYRFDDTGWTWIDSAAGSRGLQSLASYGDSLVGVGSNGLYFSTDTGNNWLPLGTGLPASTADAGSLFTTGRLLYLSLDSGLYRSSDAGANWELISTTSRIIWPLITRDAYIYVNTPTGLRFSADSGRSWNPVPPLPTPYRMSRWAILDDEIFTGVSYTDHAHGRDNRGVWKMPIDQPVSLVRSSRSGTSGIRLAPNPSDGSTTISFSLRSATHVMIELHGIDGRLVHAIDRGILPPGDHRLTMDDLPSGIYRVGVGHQWQTLIITR
jgi:hypothetical protein